MPESTIPEKTWDKAYEKELCERWHKEQPFVFNKELKKPVYSIDTPPPYVNTPVHIGQATTYVLMDMFARYRRMKGYQVLFPLGLDRNGLPIEMAAEKKFKVKFNSIPREEFLAKCRQVLEESSMESTESFKRLGISFNSWKIGKGIGEVYETDSPDYRSLTQDTFIDLWHAGLIYEAERVNNYCPGCQTTIADAEVEYVDAAGHFYDIQFTCKETGEPLIIGTTRPELLCGLGMVIYNPTDERYAHLDGKTAISPLYKKEVPIKAHPAADIEKGTGLVMMCSYGDLTDIRFFRENQLEPVIAITMEGTMNSQAGFLEGLSVKHARKKIVEMLEEEGLLIKVTPTGSHRTPICERSKDPIEFISQKEFYVKQVEYKDTMADLAQQMNFFAPESRQIMLDWINSVSIDWPISRRRYYATEVPLWYCKGCGATIIPPKGKYHQPWKDPAPITKCPECGGSAFVGDQRVFDTWFDSSISPLYIMKYSRDSNFFEKHSPCTLRPQGKEIIRTWLYYTVLKDYLLTNKLIFKDVWINYHIVDEKGHKMSKSKGNIIDPKDVLNKFGAEPFRLWSAVEGNLEKTDFRCSSERIEGAGKTLTKLWNVARFISMFPQAKKPQKLCALDAWIIGEIEELVKKADEHYERYDFHNPAIQFKHFLWETFASHYVEMVKGRAYNQENTFSQEEQHSAHYALHHCLTLLLQALSPIIPYITALLYEKLHGKDVHIQAFPDVKPEHEAAFTRDDIIALNSSVWKVKKDAGKSLKDPVKGLTMPKRFEAVAKDIQNAHHIEKISYGEEIAVVL